MSKDSELPAYPPAQDDPMGTPTDGETVLWQGRPDLRVLARTAFHTRLIGIYFAVLTITALVMGSVGTAALLVGFGFATLALLYAAAWLTVRNTLYIITDMRVMMRIGMAVDKRINVPLKKVTAAHFAPRGKGFGDIALELGDKTVLGYLLLWPHARPWQFSRPQPMLRALADAEQVAQTLASASAQYNAIERGDFAPKPQAETREDNDGAANAAGLTGAAA
ncbi:MAG: photosynthetic complex putative assembly protein PuhB [Pseudomonadota bacterium]